MDARGDAGTRRAPRPIPQRAPVRARCARGRRIVGGAERSLHCGECRAATSAKLILVHTRCAPGHLYVPNHFPAFRMYSISPHMLGYIQIPRVQDGLLPLSNRHHVFPTALHPALSRPLQLSFPEHFISSSLAAQKPVSQNCTRDLPMPRRPPTSRGGDSYYIDITLGGQNFSAMIDMGMYALYICLTPSVLA